MALSPDREHVLGLIKAAFAAGGGAWISRRRFLEEHGLKAADIFRFFPRWSDAVAAAGIDVKPYNQKIPAEDLLEDWGELTRRFGRIPTRNEYKLEGSFSAGVLEANFGPWSQLPSAFRIFAADKTEWADVAARLPPGPAASAAPPPLPRTASGFASPVSKGQRLTDRPVYGDPIDFRGLRHAPVNEIGVVLLFGMVSRELGFLVEAVQSGFPDCEAKRQIAPGKWQRVRIEFEFESRNFVDHGHAVSGCDVLVCWRHNWAEAPEDLQIVELLSLLPALGSAAE